MKNKIGFSGERFLPDNFSAEEGISKFHRERYLFAENFTAGKTVLDIACGDGYGSDMIADVARRVYGVDNDQQSVASAQKKYYKSNLSFSVGDATRLEFADNFFDTVVSFETIEHISSEAQTQFLAEIKRVLKKEGIILISTPDKDIYGWGHNPFHLREFNKREFRSLLEKFFHIDFLYAQDIRASRSFFMKLVRQSVDITRHNMAWSFLKKAIPKTIRARVDASTLGYAAGGGENRSPAQLDIYRPQQITENQSGTYLLVLCRK